MALPGALAPREPGARRYAHVILGAGCAGLSLCHYLLERGVEEPILILDRKEAFTDDRTWCFWDVEGTPFSDRAVGRWGSWLVRADGREVVHTSERYPYLCLTGKDFYEAALEGISARGDVTVRLGEEVLGREEVDGGVLVTTSAGGSYLADRVYDGRGLAAGSEAYRALRGGRAWISQQFLGRRLRADRPVFDPDVCTLMDFSVSQERGLRFAYVLPFSEREALVENVYLSRSGAPVGAHRQEISAYLRDRYGLGEGECEVGGEEWGDIPMVVARAQPDGGRTRAIGTLGGDTRPSTGYAFLRLQRRCRALAQSVTGGEPGGEPHGGEPGRVHPWRYGPLDRVFLRLLREEPGRCPEIYARMFAGTPPDPLVRFLTETSSLLDDARLVGALPKTPFLRFAAREALGLADKAR